MQALGGDNAIADLTRRTYKAANNWKTFNRFPADTYHIMQCKLRKLGHTASPKLWRQIECKE